MIWTGSAYPPLRRLALPLLVAALSLVGVGLIAMGGSPVQPEAPAPEQRKAGIGVSTPTGYGWLTVTNVERIRGLTAKQLSGMTHGVKNLVGSKQVLVAVNVSVTNALKTPLRYGPKMFRVRVGGADGVTVPVLASQLGPGTLQPDSGIELILNFVVPAGGGRLTVLATDHNGGEVAIPIGRSVRALPGGDSHEQH